MLRRAQGARRAGPLVLGRTASSSRGDRHAMRVEPLARGRKGAAGAVAAAPADAFRVCPAGGGDPAVGIHSVDSHLAERKRLRASLHGGRNRSHRRAKALRSSCGRDSGRLQGRRPAGGGMRWESTRWIPILRKGKSCGPPCTAGGIALTGARRRYGAVAAATADAFRAVPRRRRRPRWESTRWIPSLRKEQRSGCGRRTSGEGVAAGRSQVGARYHPNPAAASRDMPPTRDTARPARFLCSDRGVERLGRPPRRRCGHQRQPLAVVPMSSAAGSAAFALRAFSATLASVSTISSTQSFTGTSEVFVGARRVAARFVAGRFDGRFDSAIHSS